MWCRKRYPVPHTDFNFQKRRHNNNGERRHKYNRYYVLFVEIRWYLRKCMFSFNHNSGYNRRIKSILGLKCIYSSRRFQRTLRFVASLYIDKDIAKTPPNGVVYDPIRNLRVNHLSSTIAVNLTVHSQSSNQHNSYLSSLLCLSLPSDYGIPCTKVWPYIIFPPLEICINNTTFLNSHTN